MVLQTTEYEYEYANSNLNCAHDYLIAPILSFLSTRTRTGAKILDLGCGNGSLTNFIAQQGYQATGMEESPSGVTMAQKNFPQCKFLEGSIYVPPPLENDFDVVISVEVVEHLFYPRELVKLAQKCLKPGGHLIVTTPYHGYWKNLVLALSGKMDHHFHVLWDGGHIKFFSVKTLSELLETEGYSDLEFKFVGRFPYLWKSMLCCAVFNQ